VIRDRASRPRRGRLAGLALGAAVLGGCAATPQLSVDSLDQPWPCSSVAWLDESGQPPASLLQQRLQSEVLSGLQARGYRVDEAAPDCLVHGLVYTGTRPGSPVSVGIGAGSWGSSVGGSVGVSIPLGGGSRKTGNLAIDVIDVKENAQVWRGTLENAFPTPEPDAVQLSGAVQQVLASLPAPAL
jgi:hypothetical protein